MKELIEFVAKSLVNDPSQVTVSEIKGQNSLTLELRVGPEDMGRVIGKGGRTVNAMRTLVQVGAAGQGKRVTLEVIEGFS
ncbi:MAG TPA: KH domain-containing protein [Chloroflexi bacterium]|nr:KH domain-containing protein [Chloroflexota bacterium]